jgi:hypothetical protein
VISRQHERGFPPRTLEYVPLRTECDINPADRESGALPIKKERLLMSKVLPCAAALALLVASSSSVLAGGHGVSSISPGHEFQNPSTFGSVSVGGPGASGYAPGRRYLEDRTEVPAPARARRFMRRASSDSRGQHRRTGEAASVGGLFRFDLKIVDRCRQDKTDWAWVAYRHCSAVKGSYARILAARESSVFFRSFGSQRIVSRRCHAKVRFHSRPHPSDAAIKRSM